ncbi:MAG: methyltransferase domain-containing protein [Thermodesulfobacteriota bacterium]
MSIDFDKRAIKTSFSKAASTYEACSSVQKEVARDLLTYLPPAPVFPVGPRRILDMGCGTGGLIRPVVSLYPDAAVYGCDIALPMLVKARETFNGKNASFVTGDFERIPFRDSTFDLVISSLTYQWAVDMERAFGEVIRVLRPGGAFVFSTLGPSTMRELRASVEEAAKRTGGDGLPAPMGFPVVEKVSGALKGVNFERVTIEQGPYRKEYKDLMDLLRTLKGVGATSPHTDGGKNLGRGTLLKETARVYKKSFPSGNDGGIAATYGVVFVAARKP